VLLKGHQRTPECRAFDTSAVFDRDI
jgi:putative CocE/NonD family hydrolase